MCCGKKPVKGKRVSTMSRMKRHKLTIVEALSFSRTLVMCRPDAYAINYSINPWMKLTDPADNQKAIEQWENLRDRFVEYGAEVLFVPSKKSLPDMTFVANAGLVFPDELVVLSNFRYDERKNEEQWFLEWFLNKGYTVKRPALPFEGAGDALFFNHRLIGGYGFRSELGVYDEIRSFVPDVPIIPVKLTNDQFYHLDTCFCPLQGVDYLIFDGAFEAQGLANIRALGGNEILVPEEEALRFACNAVYINRTVILPTGCPIVMQKLEQSGYKPVAVPMDQFIKAGGACKCLSLSL